MTPTSAKPAEPLSSRIARLAAQGAALLLTAFAFFFLRVPLAADTIAEATPPPPPSELVQYRTASSRTFDNHDGSYTTSAYSGPIHYRDEQGRFQAISSALVASPEAGYAYENEANRFRALFRQQAGADFLGLESWGGRRFRLRLQDAAQSTAQVRSRGLNYPDVFPGVDLRYELQPDGVKETLLLANAQVPTSYRFLLSPPQGARMHAVQQSDGSWALYMAPHAPPALVLEAPWLSERGDPSPAAPHASLDVTRVGQDFQLDLSLDGTWLRDPQRQFPVRVDPSLTIQPPTQDASFDFACSTCAGVASDRLPIGKSNISPSPIWRSALQFSLADIPAGASVSSATLKLYFDGTCVPIIGSTCGGTSHQVDALKMTGSWSKNSKTSQLAFNTTPLASFTLPSGAAAQWMNWSLTPTVQSWFTGGLPNFGLLLKRATEPTASSGPKPPSRGYAPEPTLGPKLEVTYNGNGGELLEPETVHANGAELSWVPYSGPGAPPFDRYEVHRGSAPNFTPSDSTRLTTIMDSGATSYRDTTAKAGATFTYKVVVNGFETNARTVTMPADGQARKTLRPDPAAGLDTYITERTDSTDCVNRGAGERLKVGTDAISIWRSLLGFDLADIPPGATVSTATLSLWHPDTTTTALNVRAHRVTGNWQEGTGIDKCTGDGATWYETVGGVAWTQLGGDFDPTVAASLSIPSGSQAGWSQWSLTSVAQQWAAGTSPNMGVLLKLDNETRVAEKSVDFYSSDFSVAPTLRPKLSLTYADGSHAIAPTVSISKPSAGIQVSGSSVQVAAGASDDRRVESVQFFVDGNSIATDTSEPFSIAWNSTTVANGSHSLTARATDDASNQTTSAAVSVTVGNSVAPTTSITSPIGGSTVTGTVTVNANASDDLAVTKVELYADGLLIGTDTSSPYSFNWSTLDPALPAYDGLHTLTTKAYDAHAQVTASAPVSVTAGNAAGTLYLADFSSSEFPPKMEYTPGAPQSYPFDITITNRSTTTWNTDIVLRYRWYRLGSTTAIFDSGNTSLGSPVLPGGQVTRQVLVTPPNMPTGLARASYRLRFDLYNVANSYWFAGQGNKPLEQPLSVELLNPAPPPPPPVPPLSAAEQLGIEPNFQYEREGLGLGMENLVNVATGNSVVRWVPMQAPGQGLSTVVQLTYNSLEGRCNAVTCPIGSSWSLSISSLTRFGKQMLKVTGNKADLVDADGTLHIFDDDDGQWVPRPGTHLYLREDSASSARRYIVTTPSRITYFYDCGENPTFVRDKNGNELSFVLDGQGCAPNKQVVDVIDAGGRAFHIDYYAGNPENKRVKLITDHSGRALQFCYDGQGGDHPNLLKIIEQGPGDPSTCDNQTVASRSVTFSYELEGSQNNRQLLSVRDPRLHDTIFEYVNGGEQQDKLDARIDRQLERTSFGYTTQSGNGTNVTTVAAPPVSAARQTEYADIHDATHEQGLVDSVTRLKDPGPPDVVTETTQIIWTEQPQPLRHVWKVIAPGNRMTEFAYNVRGLVTDTYDPLLNHTHLGYLNVPGDGGFTTDVTNVTDPNGNTWTLTYDDNNVNVEKLIDPDGSSLDPFMTFDYYAGPPGFPGAVQEATDANGNATTIESYDANGLATLVRDAKDQVTRNVFNESGLLLTVQDPMHSGDPIYSDRFYKTVYDYDAFQRVVRRSSPKSTSFDFSKLIWTDVVYDANDNIVAARQPDYNGVGETTTTSYDFMDRRKEVTNPENEKTAFTYDGAGRVTQVTRPKGLITPPPPPPPTNPDKDYSTEYRYDRLDRVVSQIVYDADGVANRRTHYCFDTPGDLRWVTAPRAGIATAPTNCQTDLGVPEYTTRYGYDAAHRLTSMTEPLSASSTRMRRLEYDFNGNVRHVIDERNTDTELVYTHRNELEKRIETFTASPLRQLTSLFVYDRAGNVTCHVSPRAWDTGSRCSEGNPGNYVTEYRYDVVDQLERISLPDDVGGDSRTYNHRRYDANGNLRLTTLPVEDSELGTLCDTGPQQCTELKHFDPGWIFTSDDHVNPEVLYDYEAEGWQNFRRLCDDDNRCKRTIQQYFSDGLLRSVSRGSARREREGNALAKYVYDPNNNMTSAFAQRSTEISQLGSTITSQYNGYDEPTNVSQQQQNEPNPHFTDYTYDPNGNVGTRVDNRTPPSQNGRKHEFTYDQADQLTQDYDWVNQTRDDVGDLRTEYLYTSTGWDDQKTVERLTSVPNGWQIKVRTKREYFDNGDLKLLWTKNAGLQEEVERHDLTYTNGSVYMNGNRVIDSFKLKGPGGGGPCYPSTCTITYGYGPRDNVTNEDNSWRADTQWDYNDALNVTTETSGSTTRTFTYQGNRLDEERVGGQLVARYVYDVEGNVDCVVGSGWQGSACPPAPGQGAQIDPALIADYHWDFLNRLKSFRQFGGGLASADYSYDALDRLVRQTGTQGGTTRRTCFSYLGTTQAVSDERRVSPTNDCNATPTLTKSYGFDADLERTTMSVTGAGADDGNYVYARNVHGDPSLLLKDGGARMGSYGYSAYGSPDPDLTGEEALEQTTPFNAYRFNDRRLDTVSGSSDMGARRYSSATGGGRFLQFDSYEGAEADLGLALGSLTQNRYGFAAGNPLSFLETDGHAFAAAESGGRQPPKPPMVEAAPASLGLNSDSSPGEEREQAIGAHEATWERLYLDEGRKAAGVSSVMAKAADVQPYARRVAAIFAPQELTTLAVNQLPGPDEPVSPGWAAAEAATSLVPGGRGIGGPIKSGLSRLLSREGAGKAANAGNSVSHPLLRPGPYAGDSIPARGSGQTFRAAERRQIDDIGARSGCHSCGVTNPGTKSGHFVPDHQPVSSLNDLGLPQQLFPQCLACSREQGLFLARLLRGEP